MGANIAVFSTPIPALTYPALSIVSTLARRGHQLTCITSERFAAHVGSLGADVLRCPRLDYPFDQDNSSSMPIEHQYARSLQDLALRTFASTLPLLNTRKPDLIIYDSLAFAGVLVAEKLGVRTMRMSNQFSFAQEALDSGLIPEEWKATQVDLDATANQLFASQQSQRRNVIRSNIDETFYLYSHDLQLCHLGAGSEVFYAPRCAAERPNIGWWKAPTPRHRPRALMTRSTTYPQDREHYEHCLNALSRSGWDTIVATGSSAILSELNSLPANCRVLHDLPLVTVMPHVDVIVCAAGLATAMEAAYHGRPMLMLTSGHAELEMYADRFQDHGLGIHLRGADASPENVAQSAARLLNDRDLRQRLKRATEAVRRGAGAEELVNWIEERLALAP